MDFIKKLKYVPPFEIKKVQTCNGKEFEKHFREYLEKENLDDVNLSNSTFIEYLIWFNSQKPHKSLNCSPPLQFIIKNAIIFNNKKSYMLWTLTGIWSGKVDCFFMEEGDLMVLVPKSRRPKKKRQRQINKEIINFIIKYREEHPGIGQVAIKFGLDGYCKEKGIKSISESSIERVIKDLKDRAKEFLKII